MIYIIIALAIAFGIAAAAIYWYAGKMTHLDELDRRHR